MRAPTTTSVRKTNDSSYSGRDVARPQRLVRLGVLLEATASPESALALAVLAERAGLDSLWLAGTGRHLTVRDPRAAVATLATVAAGTTRITLGAYLTPPPGALPGALAGRFAATTARSDTVVELAASVGRTTAEAEARVEADPRLRLSRDPRRSGLFGTLEECQAHVAELASAGVTEVRCWVPRTPDIHDAIAQLAAVAVGTLSPSVRGRRSRPPPAPSGWGGRPRLHGTPPL